MLQYGSVTRKASFNLNDPQEREAYHYSQTINFSKWAKEQLMREIKRKQRQAVSVRVEGET